MAKKVSKKAIKKALKTTKPQGDRRKKGIGFFGNLPNLKENKKGIQSESTELSAIVAKNFEVPTLSKSLTKKQVKSVLKGRFTKETDRIARADAVKRIKEGKSPFAGNKDRIEARRRGASLGLVINPKPKSRRKKKKEGRKNA